ncbi:MAG: ABC transporter permease [Candidatus Dormibacteraceae bacterium]
MQRATHLPGWIAITASMLSGLALAVASLVALLIVGRIGGVSLDGIHWLLLGLAVIFGSLPMLGLGMILGYGTSPNLAPALASLIYLPLAFASGLFVPLSNMPAFVQHFALYLPLYHLGELGWNVVGGSDESVAQAILWIIGWSVVLFAIAVRVYRIDQQRKFA